jgi:hypothetical protein
MMMEPLNAEHAKAREEAWLRWSADLPADVLPDARAAWEKTIAAQSIDLHFAMADFASAALGLFRRRRPTQ